MMLTCISFTRLSTVSREVIGLKRVCKVIHQELSSSGYLVSRYEGRDVNSEPCCAAGAALLAEWMSLESGSPASAEVNSGVGVNTVSSSLQRYLR